MSSADESGNTSLCPELDAAEQVDVTFYRRFFPLVDKKSGDYVTFPFPMQPFPTGIGSILPAISFPRLPVGKDLILTKKQKKLLQDNIKQILKKSPEAPGLPVKRSYLVLGIEYEQLWQRRGVHKGRLLGTVPLGLFPASKEVTIRSWEKVVERRVLTESLEEVRTTEINGTEKWSMAAKKQIVRTTNSKFNPSATLNSITIPAAGGMPVTLQGGLGITGEFSAGSQDTVNQGTDFIEEATFKALETIKNARTSTIETTTEVGHEETGRETLANPNRLNTLTYLYFEVVEDYEIRVKPRRVDLFLFIPLPLQDKITAKWLVDHECILRPIIPCDTLRSGFDAARRLLMLQELRSLRERSANAGGGGSAGAGTGDIDLSEVVAAADTLIRCYNQLSGAEQTDQGAGSWLYWELVKLLAPNLQRGLDTFAERWGSSGFDKNNRGDVTAALQALETDIGDVNAEFLKVNAAVGFLIAEVVIGAIGPYLPLILALTVALEVLGLDAIPDDRGLEDKLEKLLAKLHGILTPLMPPSLSPTAGGPAGATAGVPAPDTGAALLAWQLKVERELADESEAKVLVHALAQHVYEHIYFYHQAIWSGYDSNQIKVRLAQLHLPVDAFEHSFHGFDLNFGAIRLINEQTVFVPGQPGAVSSLKAFQTWRKQILLNSRQTVSKISLPTGGTIVEPYLGRCQGGDDFVRRHREIDISQAEAELALARARAAQAEEEVHRLQERLKAGLLDDPSPYGRAEKLEVEVGAAAPTTPPAALPAGGTSSGGSEGSGGSPG